MSSDTLDRMWSRRKLPASCIESTCHAIQCVTGGKWDTWGGRSMTTRNAGVWAAFGNRFICVSRFSHVETAVTGVTDFDDLGAGGIATMLKEGRGIMLANTTTKDAKFNMHLGAIIQSRGGTYFITDMSEDDPIVDASGKEQPLRNTDITAAGFKSDNIIAGFRGHEYGDSAVFKVGLLICEADSAFSVLSQRYTDEQKRDEK